MGRIGLNRSASTEAWTAVTIPTGNTSDIGYFIKPSSNADTATYKAFVASSGGVERVQINNTGSATFAGQITSGSNAFGTNNTGSGLTATGSVIARRANSENIWLGYQTGTTQQTSQIGADGSASFASTVLVGDMTGAPSAGSTAYGNYIEGIGGYFTNRSAAGSTVLKGYQQGTLNVDITAGGSATFAGSLNVGTVPVHADNAAATAAGLVAGDVYRKSDGTLMITF